MDRNYRINAKRIFMPFEEYNFAFAEGKQRLRKGFKEGLKIEAKNKYWVSLAEGQATKPKIIFELLNKYINDIGLVIEYDIMSEEAEESNSPRIMDDILQEYLGNDVIIPYNLNERKSKYHKVFYKLDSYMKNNGIISNADSEEDE